MSRYSLNPDRLFDRPWRPGHPFRPRTGRFRRLAMFALLVILCVLIWGYGFLTDAKRVRAMAEGYLSSLVGGRVTVADASLSLFEGLRLDGVRVYVDEDLEENAPPDGLIFSARTFIIQYDPRSMLRGQLEAQQIIAEKPQVHLSWDVKNGQWNFNRLGKTRRPRPAPKVEEPVRPPPMPELLLRNARVEISELREGKNAALGFIAIDGQLTPQSSAEGGPHDRYGFILQSRGLSDAMGPLVTGNIHLQTGRVIAQLKQFEFGRDVRTMLPADVGQWWERHELGGRIDVPVMDYTPVHGKEPPRFRIETVLNGVNLTVPPEELMSGQEVARRVDSGEAAALMRRAFSIGGMERSNKQAARPAAVRPPADLDLHRAAPLAEGMPVVPVLLTSGGSAPGSSLAAPKRSNPADGLTATLETTPLQLRQVSGSFIFTESGIDVRGLAGRVENNLLAIDGHIDGYNPEARASMHIGSSPGEDLLIPASPRYIWSMPAAVREFYEKLRPQGTCRLKLDVARQVEAGPITAGGYVELLDAQFLFDEFPYPLRQMHGRIELTRDPAKNQDWLLLKDLRGSGFPGGPNQDRTIDINGWIGPIGPPGLEPGGLIKIHGGDIASEPALLNAFHDDVREALAIFDAPGKGEFPKFRGDMLCEVYRDIGATGFFKVRVDLDIKEAYGALVGFPYPLRGLSGQVRIREGYAEIIGVRVPHEGAMVGVEGRVAWDLPGTKFTGELAKRRTDLKLTVRDLPIDQDLLGALPKDRADWIAKTGIRGKIDVDGRLLGEEGGKVPKNGKPALTYDLNLRLHDGTVRPADGKFEVAGVTGLMHLTSDQLDLLEMKGTRGHAALSAMGQIVWAGNSPRTVLAVSGQNLPTDAELYDVLPEAAKTAWSEIQPRGTLDAEVTYASRSLPAVEAAAVPASGVPGTAVTVVDLNKPTTPTTEPTALLLDLSASGDRLAVRRDIPLGLNGTIRPRDLSATIRTVPYVLEQLAGEVSVSPERIELRKITAKHGGAQFTIGGTGTLVPRPERALSISAKDVPIDDALRKALPASVSGLMDSLKMKGTLGVEFDKFTYRSGAAATVASTQPGEPELDLSGKLTLSNVAMDVGAPMEQVNGTAALAVSVRGSRLNSLDGTLDIGSFEMSGRKVTDFRATLAKPPDQAEFSLTKMQGTLGGGDLAGQVTVSYPEIGPARYALGLVVRNADIRELANEQSETINGRLTASLALEGNWGKASNRRGRGDVVVSGKEMYRIPLVLGLLQVTNLSLPISTPFSSGTARYSVDGDKVTFERIELRSNNILMAGDGSLDFATKQVRMTFVTDNPGAFKIPFLQDLWRGAQQELLRIHVKGTVQDPKVEAQALGTFTTSVDEVFRGDPPKTKPTKPKK